MSIIWTLEMIVHKFTMNHFGGAWYDEKFLVEWKKKSPGKDPGTVTMNDDVYCAECGYKLQTI